MGDVLPHKRQNVVDRLRVRLERYRWHHNSCLPRYEQSANSICEKQRQDTIRLKQKFLESKTKKTKSSKSDHHRTSSAAKEPTPDTQKLISLAKPIKALAEGSPANSTTDAPSDDVDKSVKAQAENLLSESSKEPSKSNNFSLKMTQKFPKCNPSVHTAKSTNEPSQQVTNTTNQAAPALSRISSKDIVNSIECKQEVERNPDLCDIKITSQDNVSTDRLSDTFPSFGFTEDSGDDVIHPDILKDLIDDVFTNSADIMKDFNFGDAVSNMKDDDKVEISDLVKGPTPELQMQTFRSDNLMFSNHSMIHDRPSDSSLFENRSTSGIAPLPATTSTTSIPVTNSSLFKAQQNLPNYSVVSNLNPSLEFKMSEPSPAALTLKQMAEQHQNMQQKQQQLNVNVNIPFNARNSFTMNSFSDPFSAKFMNQPALKIPTSSMFQSLPYDSGDSYPGTTPIINNNSNTFKQELCPVASNNNNRLVSMGGQKNNVQWLANDQKKHVPSTGQLDRINPDQNPSQNIMTSQYMPLEVQLQMHQLIRPQQGTVATQAKQLDSRYSNAYSYNGQIYNMLPNQNYNTSYNMLPNNARPPPEYKSHQMIRPSQQQPMQCQRPPHQISPNISGNQWWPTQQQNQTIMNMYQQQQDGYANLNCTGSIPTNVSHYNTHPYRTAGQVSNRVPPPNITVSSHPMIQQQRSNQQLHQQCSTNPNLDINLAQVYGVNHDLVNRPDSQINLDFLDHIENSASDLLNFDQVMQNTETTHFQLLDDMEMLSK